MMKKQRKMENNYILITFLLAVILLKIIVTIFKNNHCWKQEDMPPY